MHSTSIVSQGSQPKQAIPLVIPSTPRPSSPCSCGGSKAQPVISDNTTHYAAWRCAECVRFRGWIPKPKNLTATQADDELIDALLTSGRLNAWELAFCRSIRDVKNRSLKQREKLREIAENLGLTGHEQIADKDISSHLLSGGES